MKDLKKTETEKVRFSLGVDYLIICIKVIYKKKHGKFSPNQKKKKPSQTEKTEPNWFEQVFVFKNQTKPKPVSLNRFRFVFFLISV
jgi:hypothetical protein